MTRPVALLTLPASTVGPDLAARLADLDVPARLLDLDAPLNGEPVTVRGAAVTWQGCELHRSGAIWLEQPVFPWPQTLPPPCPLPDMDNFRRWQTYQREARALAVAALATACETVPAINPPVSAHLAVAPTVALDLLQAAGLAVHPWSVQARAADPVPALTIDPTGRDRWHRPAGAPPAGPRLTFADCAGRVAELLVLDGQVIGATLHAQAAGWAAQGLAAAEVMAVADVPAAWSRLGAAAAAALDLELLQIACRADEAAPAILWPDAAPDLAAWQRAAGPGIGAALARRLAALAAD